MTDSTRNRSIARKLTLTMNTPDCWDDGSRVAIQRTLVKHGLLPEKYSYSQPNEEIYQDQVKVKTRHNLRINENILLELPSSMLAGERSFVCEALSTLIPDRDVESWIEEEQYEEIEPPSIQDGSTVFVRWDPESEDATRSITEGDASILINELSTKSPQIALEILVSGPTIEDVNSEAVQLRTKDLKNRFVAAATNHGCYGLSIDCKVNSSFFRSETCDASFLMEADEEE